MLGTVQFSSLAGGGCVAGPGGGLKRHRCKRKKLEKQITLVVEPPEAAPWGRKAQRTPPIPGSELRDVTCTLLLTFAASPTPKLSSARQSGEGNPLPASPQIS